MQLLWFGWSADLSDTLWMHNCARHSCALQFGGIPDYNISSQPCHSMAKISFGCIWFSRRMLSTELLNILRSATMMFHCHAQLVGFLQSTPGRSSMYWILDSDNFPFSKAILCAFIHFITSLSSVSNSAIFTFGYFFVWDYKLITCNDTWVEPCLGPSISAPVDNVPLKLDQQAHVASR